MKRKKGGGRAGERERRGAGRGHGETVGEAKWAALRQLEQLVPGLDRESVRFQVVTEGERGLLGVGYTPAQVVATAPGVEGGVAESDSVSAAREFVDRIAAAIEASVSTTVSERGGTITVTCTGPDLGLLIGKARADHRRDPVPRQRVGEGRRRPARDRRRRCRLPRAAAQPRSSPSRSARRAALPPPAGGVELDPMTAIERKIVHEALKDDPRSRPRALAPSRTGTWWSSPGTPPPECSPRFSSGGSRSPGNPGAHGDPRRDPRLAAPS